MCYTYDANGNTLSDPSGKSYSWDFENRLVSATVPGTGTVAFKYDPFGRRTYKSSPNFTGIFVYDGDNLIETLTSSGSLVSRYTETQNIDEPLAELSSGGASFYEGDALGSITSLTNPGGTIANTYTYDSFGNVTNFTGTLSNPFRFTGRESDPETGLYYYRARYFDPNVGRFVSEDPIRFYGGTNFYRYVRNNPARYGDRFGLEDLPDACTLCHFFCKLRFAMLTGVNTTWYFGRGMFAAWSLGSSDGPVINLFIPVDDPVSMMNDQQETKNQCRRGDLNCHQQCNAKCGVPTPPFPF
jgi:RHS repeat-associated protein